jgi:uncharacterized protein YjbJ (UPF0337 family)
MNKTHVDGKLDDLKGRAKEDIGHVMGNSKLESEGIFDQIKGKVEDGFADAKDAVKRGVDRVLHPDHSNQSERY